MSNNTSPANRQAFSKLDSQEKQVLLFLSEGRTDKEIARAVFPGEGTIDNYVNSILSKLGLMDRAKATAKPIVRQLCRRLLAEDCTGFEIKL